MIKQVLYAKYYMEEWKVDKRVNIIVPKDSKSLYF